MRRGGLLWGLLLLMGGILFLLDNLGFLPISALSLFFPSVLILIGLWFLVGPLFFRQVIENRSLVIPADGTTESVINIQHGAGGVNVASMAGNANLLEGTFAGGVEEKIERSGNKTSIKLSIPEIEWFGFPSISSSEGFKWDISLNQSTAYALNVKTGASKNRFDLHDLIITDIKMDQGANDTEVLLPEQAGFTCGEFHFGSARLELVVPENVAAQIKIDGALLDTNEIDQVRFPKTGDVFCSPNYSSAANKVDIKIEAGVGKVVIH
jgi:hypothetical protein